MSVHDDVRAKIAPLTDALVNCVTELELLPPEHRVRVMRALNALFQGQSTTNPLDWYSKQGVIGTLSTQPAQLGGSAQDAYAKSMASYGDGVLR